MDSTLIAALIGLAGVVVGTLITSVINLVLTKKQAKMRVLEKVFDKRIQAHENILTVVNGLRSVISLERVNDERHLLGYPGSLKSNAERENFMYNSFLILAENSHWIGTELERELGFLKDYLTSLHMTVKGIDDNNLIEVGILIKQDFIDLAMSIEDKTFDFFRKDIYKVSINKKDEWHKYPKEVTFKRFENTLLHKHHDDIEALKA